MSTAKILGSIELGGLAVTEFAKVAKDWERRHPGCTVTNSPGGRHLLVLEGGAGVNPTTCGCYTCEQQVIEAVGGFRTMNLCGTCGNKRCPRASHHDNECSGSNDPGQPGSRYEGQRPGLLVMDEA